MKIGIDLALRKIGIVVLDDNNNLIDFTLFDSDPKKLNNEDLLFSNGYNIFTFIDNAMKNEFDSIYVNLEGLTFNSKSASMDLIDANHWYVRVRLKSELGIKVNVIPPKSWQKSICNLFPCEVNNIYNKWPIIRAKKGLKLTKEEKSLNNRSKANIRKEMKAFFYSKLPDDIKESFSKYILNNKLPKDGIYDLSDAYWICINEKINLNPISRKGKSKT